MCMVLKKKVFYPRSKKDNLLKAGDAFHSMVRLGISAISLHTEF